MPQNNVGKVVQVIGAVVDIRFEKDNLPNLLNAIEIELNGKKLVCEVAQHIGDDVVRCIAMSSTDGLVRGTDAIKYRRTYHRSCRKKYSGKDLQSSRRTR